MPQAVNNLNIDAAAHSNMSNAVSDVVVNAQQTDGVQDQEETFYQNTKFTQWLGYYKEIPEVKTAIDMRATWTGGGGYEADPETSVILDHISGMGNDNFNSIMKNLRIVRRIGGDAFAEVIRDESSGILINLKPLDPSTIKIVVNKQGIIKRYEQVTKAGSKSTAKKYTPDKIFHLVNKRVADEIHGVSDIEAIEQIILANKESFTDMKMLQHRFVKPMMKFTLDTDDQTKINKLIATFDEAVQKGENLYIPKGAVEHELIAVPSNSTLNPLPWREHLRNYFYQVVGIPQIVLGNAAEFSESSAKIAYLAFEQSVDEEQNEDEAQVWNQLGLRVTWSFPASLRNELLSDEKKDSSVQQSAFQQADTAATPVEPQTEGGVTNGS